MFVTSRPPFPFGHQSTTDYEFSLFCYPVIRTHIYQRPNLCVILRACRGHLLFKANSLTQSQRTKFDLLGKGGNDIQAYTYTCNRWFPPTRRAGGKNYSRRCVIKLWPSRNIGGVALQGSSFSGSIIIDVNHQL